MPFVRITSNPEGFIWRYRENEVVNMNTIINTRMLIIIPDIADQYYTHKVPSLDVFNETGLLEHLEICELDVMNLPKIPDSVRSLEIKNTNITNINQIHANWGGGGNLTTLILDSNKKLKGSVIVPDGVLVFAIMNQIVNVIRLPFGIKKVQCGPRIKFMQLSGEMPEEMLYFVNVISNPYKKELDEIDRLCDDEIRESLAMYEDMIIQKWHFRKIKCIEEVNKNINYKLYAEFGFIPKRIRVSSVEDLKNPIIVAMNLASNYPRRMAEFLCEEDTTTY